MDVYVCVLCTSEIDCYGSPYDFYPILELATMDMK